MAVSAYALLGRHSMHLGLLRDQGKFLKRVAVFRSSATAHGERPGHFAHVEIVLGIQRQPVWRREAAGCGAVGCAPACKQLALRIENAEAGMAHTRDWAEAV